MWRVTLSKAKNMHVSKKSAYNHKQVHDSLDAGFSSDYFPTSPLFLSLVFQRRARHGGRGDTFLIFEIQTRSQYYFGAKASLCLSVFFLSGRCGRKIPKNKTQTTRRPPGVIIVPLFLGSDNNMRIPTAHLDRTKYKTRQETQWMKVLCQLLLLS